MFNQYLTSNQSYVHKKFMLLNEFIVLFRRGDDMSSCFHLKDDLSIDTYLRWVCIILRHIHEIGDTVRDKTSKACYIQASLCPIIHGTSSAG